MDGRTWPTKAEHAVDLETGAIIAVTVQGADEGDTTTIEETLDAAEKQLEAVTEKVTGGQVHPDGLSEMLADKGYHSDETLIDLEDRGLRSYVSEPDRGRRKWDLVDAQMAVYANRRRIRGDRRKRLHRLRGDLLERPCAHLSETGAMRRVHLRGHTNILKRLLIHTAGFNLGLLLRTLVGIGPRGYSRGYTNASWSPEVARGALKDHPSVWWSGRDTWPLSDACPSHCADTLRMAFTEHLHGRLVGARSSHRKPGEVLGSPWSFGLLGQGRSKRRRRVGPADHAGQPGNH